MQFFNGINIEQTTAMLLVGTTTHHNIHTLIVYTSYMYETWYIHFSWAVSKPSQSMLIYIFCLFYNFFRLHCISVLDLIIYIEANAKYLVRSFFRSGQPHQKRTDHMGKPGIDEIYMEFYSELELIHK